MMEELPPFRLAPASSSGKSLLDNVPQGDIIDGLVLKLTGTTHTPGNLAEVNVKLGGKDVVRLTGTQLQEINYYNGVPQDSTYLPIWFADFNAHARQQWSEGSLDTLNQTYANIQISVRWDGNQSADADIAGRLIPGQQKVGPSDRMDTLRRMFRALIDTQQDMETGTQHFDLFIGSTAGAQIMRAYFFSANCTDLEVKRDGVNLVDKLPVADLDYLVQHGSKTPQTDVVVYDPTYMDFRSRSVPTLRGNGTPVPFRWILTMSGAETVTGVSDILTTIDRL